MTLVAFLVIRGEMSIGSLIGFMALLLNVDKALGLLSQGRPDCIQAIGGMERVEALLREPGGVMDAADARPAPSVREIAFRDVTFGYPGRPASLRHVSFTVPARRHVAFVGRSGAGKSTILRLIARFYDAREGTVTVNGEDVRRVTQHSLRARMAIVLQETVLFSGTIRENISFARPDATDVEIEAAATAAQIHHVIRSWPDGYATVVGEGGKVLSGGQRQAIALARALVRNAEILLLDEATTGLDPEMEAAFNRALAELARERTIISVTHRLPTVAHADQIFVIDGGEVVERGTHRELLDLEGTYHRLWQQQSGFVVSPDGREAEITPARLSRVPLFADLSEALRSEICDRFVSESYAAGTTIVEQDEPGDTFYIVVRGSVAVVRRSPGEAEQRLRVLQDGDFFGEIALLEDVGRTSTVRTLGPTLLLALTRPHFLRLLEAAPGVRRTVEAAAAAAPEGSRGRLTARPHREDLARHGLLRPPSISSASATIRRTTSAAGRTSWISPQSWPAMTSMSSVRPAARASAHRAASASRSAGGSDSSSASRPSQAVTARVRSTRLGATGAHVGLATRFATRV